MLGAITGDIVGSPYEGRRFRTKSLDFSLFGPRTRFTDDTVMTVAVADAILRKVDYAASYREWGCTFPDAGYGYLFKRWLTSPDPKPYNSFGNGSAMRVSPVAYAFNSLDEVLTEAEHTALPTHNHPEGIRGAKAVAACTFLARSHRSKGEIKDFVERTFGYDLSRTTDEIRPTYSFDSTCQGSVPEAIIAFLDSHDFESAIRLAISLGGDADTQACIAGAIAEAFYGGVPEPILKTALSFLHPSLLAVVRRFCKIYPCPTEVLEE